jgi:hypothetical protein
MTFIEMYSLTPRSFFNAVDGFRKREDNNSKERWIQTRKIMFSVMKPYLSEGVEEYEIQPFEWELGLIETSKKEQEQKALEGAQKTRDYWEEFDRKQAEKKQKTELD